MATMRNYEIISDKIKVYKTYTDTMLFTKKLNKTVTTTIINNANKCLTPGVSAVGYSEVLPMFIYKFNVVPPEQSVQKRWRQPLRC